MAQKTKKQKTTRDKSFNYNKDVDGHMISTISNYTATKDYKDIRLMGADDGMTVTGKKIKDHAADNRTLKDLDYNVTVPTTNIDPLKTYDIYGAPFQVVLNNKQHYNNCGVESTLNTLAMAGKIKMKENLSDQKSIEKNFLKAVWNLGLVNDEGVIGKLDEADGGTELDDYKDILRQFDIDSESYFMTTKCDGTQFSDLNELGYKISQGYGAVVGVYASALWQETAKTEKEDGKEGITHAIAITGVVYANGVDPTELDDDGKYKNTPVGFYIHDSGGWMSRYISIDEFKEVTLYEKHGMLEADKGEYWNYDDETVYAAGDYSENLRKYDPELREYVGKQPNGIVVTITTKPIKNEMFNFNATGDKQDNNIWGNSGDNVIKGMAGKDILYGNAGDDEIRGGKGNDIVIGNNISAATKEILNSAMFDFALPTTIGTSETYQEGINKLYGDAGNDIIVGGDDIDLIYGGEGNDKIYAGDGRNAVYGGKGNDLLLGGWENDRLFGDAGNDTIYGWGDEDTIHGGAGNDTIFFEGTEHGIDMVSSEGGSTTFKFIDEKYGDAEPYSYGAKVSDMYFAFGKGEDSLNKYDFGIAYTPDSNNVKDAIQFESFYNFKKNTAKSLTIVDAENESYKVSASKSAKVNAATNTNNIMFSLRDMGAEITTSEKNDVVTMVETEDVMNIRSESASVYDTVKYTGGIDRYVSEERNTYYGIDGGFGASTTLSIYDNIEALEKVILDPSGKPILNPDGTFETDKTVVSTDDRLYTNTVKTNLNFFFDVGLNDNNDAVVTGFDGLFILNNLTDADRLKTIANGEDNITGYIYMGDFFKEDAEIKGTGFYGNGKIETIYYNEDTAYTELSQDLANIASDVAGWLESNGYTSAFDAFKDETINPNDLAQLIACYNLN